MHPVEQLLRPLDQLGDVDALQSVFETASRQPHTDIDVLSHLHEEVRTDHPAGDLRSQSLDNLRRRGLTLSVWFQHDRNLPVLAVVGLSLLPVCDAKPCTSGSLKMISPSSR